MEDKIIVIEKESLFLSILKDIFTFIGFGVLLWFNHHYLSGSAIVDVLFIILVLMLVSAKSRRFRKFSSKEDVVRALSSEYSAQRKVHISWKRNEEGRITVDLSGWDERNLNKVIESFSIYAPEVISVSDDHGLYTIKMQMMNLKTIPMFELRLRVLRREGIIK